MSNTDYSNTSLEESNDSISVDKSISDDQISINVTPVNPQEDEEEDHVASACIITTRRKSSNWKTAIDNGLIVKNIVKVGIPSKRPQKGDICTINLEGRKKDGTIVEEGILKIRYLYGEVIQGVDLALAHMAVEEEAEFEIDSSLAYGALGLEPLVSPGEPLLYKVTLVNVEQESPLQELSVEERLFQGKKLKERGNWWYLRNEFSSAENCYRKALELLSEDHLPETRGDELIQKLLMEQTNTRNNLAGALIKRNQLDPALKEVEAVLEDQPDNVKALFRKSKILKEKGNLIESLKALKKAMSLETSSETLTREHSLLLESQRKVSLRQRELFRKFTRNKTAKNILED